MKLVTFSGELMWTVQLGGGGVLSLDLQCSNGCTTNGFMMLLIRTPGCMSMRSRKISLG